MRRISEALKPGGRLCMEALEEFRADDGIRGPASCWIVTATAP